MYLVVSNMTSVVSSVFLLSAFLLHAIGMGLLPLEGYREGFLWKRGRDNGQYLSRKFILSEQEGVLKYFNKHDVRVFPTVLETHIVVEFSITLSRLRRI